jgi:hypothetical protein
VAASELKMKDQKKVYKFFWPWQDADQEAWLHEMANQGWHLLGLNSPGRYTFSAGKPANIVYRLDFQGKRDLELGDYFQLFQDAGWEHVGKMGGWHYFRKAFETSMVDEIFTDNQTKVEKYNRLAIYLISPAVGVLFVIMPAVDYFTPAAKVAFALCYCGLLYVVIRILVRIQQLRRRL